MPLIILYYHEFLTILSHFVLYILVTYLLNLLGVFCFGGMGELT